MGRGGGGLDDTLYHAKQESLDEILFEADTEKHLINLLDLDLARKLFSG